jgi:hypothetical protein
MTAIDDDALAAAIVGHFCKLFEVLMADPSPNGLKRFEAGLAQLLDAERAVVEVINRLGRTT